MNEQTKVAALKSFLVERGVGPILELNKVSRLLLGCWDQLDGGDATSMRAEKLSRIEHATWDPPVLRFQLERHGQTVMGSTRATVYVWSVDLDDLTASCAAAKQRQVVSADKRLDVKPIAESLAKAIVSGRSDKRIQILPNGTVKLNMGVIIPATYKQTTGARRSRLRRQLDALLAPQGWKSVRPNLYSKEER